MMDKDTMTILIDMDDTIEYLLVEWLDMLNEQFGTHVTEDDIHEYDLTVAFPCLSPDDVYAPLFTKELWERVKPVPGARYAIERLQNDGHDVYIVTSSNFQTIYTKISSIIYRYFPTIDSQHIILASKKQMIRGDVLIDDAPHNLIGGDYLKIMPTAAHNRDFNAAGNRIIRADSWNEIYNIICDYRILFDAVNHMRLDAFVNTMTLEEACEKLSMTKKGFVRFIERLDSELAFMDEELK